MNTKPITYPQEDRWSYLWLLIGVLLSMLSWAAFGRWVIRLALCGNVECFRSNLPVNGRVQQFG